MKRIIFIINGYGLGNSTRCTQLIEYYQMQGYSIDIFTSGNGLKYFKERSIPNTKTYHLIPIKYSLSDNKISTLKTILNFSDHFKTLSLNAKKIKQHIQKHDTKTIFVDSDYSYLFWRKYTHANIIAVNNAFEVLSTFYNKKKFKLLLIAHFYFELADLLINYIICNKILCPCLSYPNNKPYSQILFKKMIFIPPLVRSEFTAHSKQNAPSLPLKGLLFLSSSGVSDAIMEQYLSRLKKYHISILTPQMRSAFNYNLFCQYDFFIINAGASSLAEIMALKKPALVYPIPRHAEQEINASIYHDLKLGIKTSEKSLFDNIEKLLKYYAEYHEQNANRKNSSLQISKLNQYL